MASPTYCSDISVGTPIYTPRLPANSNVDFPSSLQPLYFPLCTHTSFHSCQLHPLKHPTCLLHQTIVKMHESLDKKEEGSLKLCPEAPVVDGTVQNTIHDEVFGDITEEGPNYRAVCLTSRSNLEICRS